MPNAYQPLFYLPSRFGLAVVTVCILAIASAGRIATGAHPQTAILDSLLWAGAAISAVVWYTALRSLSNHLHDWFEQAIFTREQRLLDYRRAVLTAARGDRTVIIAVARSWPDADGAGALLAEMLAHAIRGCAAFMLGISIAALGVGAAATVQANLGLSPVALTGALSVCSCFVRWSHLGWRFLGWRRGLNDVRRAQTLLDTLE